MGMNVWVIMGLVAVAAVVFLLPRLKWISVQEAQALLESGAVLVDVRSPGEYHGGSVPGAVNIPLGELPGHLEGGQLSRDQPVLLFCASGTRSSMAKRQLQSAGFVQVHNLGSFSRARQLQPR
jgi:rhodanese-related sulfurtransferase